MPPRALFAAAMILYPTWYDPYRDTLCELETPIDALAAQARAWREDHHGWDAWGMRLWKRRPLQQFFGQSTPVRFRKGPPEAPAPPRRAMIWASKTDTAPDGALRVEDGFLRSRGLGAELVPPLSLVCDDLGIYYDPDGPSRVEKWIEKRADLRPDQHARARRVKMRAATVDQQTQGRLARAARMQRAQPCILNPDHRHLAFRGNGQSAVCGR